MTVSTQRTRRRQLREETREQIVAAAQEFLEQHAFRDLSVNALMQRTGHTRSVFYRHFDDIPALMLALIAESSTELVAVAQQWADTDTVTPGEARRRLALFVDYYVRNGRVIHAVSEAARHDDAVEAAQTALIEGFVQMTVAAIERRIAEGEISVPDAQETARALVWMLNAYLDDALGRRRDTDPERVLAVVSTIWTRTLFGEAV
jgi:AcrR family transcriptional regulator